MTRLANPATRLSAITSSLAAPIGRGGMGEVYRAGDLRLGQLGGEPPFGRDLLD